jgi:hypothetical protein
MRTLIALILVFVGRSVFAQEPAGIELGMVKLRSITRAVGAEYEVVVTEGRTTSSKKYSVFVSNDTMQIVDGTRLSSVDGNFRPLDKSLLESVKTGKAYTARTSPDVRLGAIDFSIKVVGNFSYHIVRDLSYFPVYPTPLLLDLNKFSSPRTRDQRTIDIHQIIHHGRSWDTVRSEPGTYSTVLNEVEGSTKQGNPCALRTLLMVHFAADHLGSIPNKAWITAEWVIGSRSFIMPYDSSSKRWEFGDWQKIADNLDYPMKQIETEWNMDVTMQTMLDETSGRLADLEEGKFKAEMSIVRRKEFTVDQVRLFPVDSTFFVEPPDGVYVSDVDASQQFVQGVADPAESNRLLGIANVDMPPSPRPWGKWLVFLMGGVIAFIVMKKFLTTRNFRA